MRTIKFRGCEWNADNELLPFVYGKLCDVDVIRTIKGVDKVVHYKTVGQFSGLHDKKGKEIYEGDIIKGETRNFTVKFEEGMFTTDVGKYILNGDYEVIGNIHENTELLKAVSSKNKA